MTLLMVKNKPRFRLKDEDLETMVRAGYIDVNTDENDDTFIMLIKQPTA